MARAVVLIGAVLVLAGCTSHEPPVTQEAPAPPQSAVPNGNDPHAKIPCDDVIITIGSWFCPTPPTDRK